MELDLGTIVTSVSGPKRPHDRVAVSDMQTDFRACLTNKVSRCPLFFLLFRWLVLEMMNLLGCATNKAQ